MKMKCKICSVEKLRTKTSDNKYLDENSNYWHGRRCYECNIKRHIERSRKLGHKNIKDVTAKNIVKGLDSERRAVDFLKKLGAEIINTSNVRGADITFKMFTDRILKAEVKTVSGYGKKGLYVQPIKPNRLKDDLVIMVFKDSFFIDDMDNHLKHCGKNGARYVTRIERESYKIT